MKAAYFASVIFVVMIAGCSSESAAVAKAKAEADAAKAAQAKAEAELARIKGFVRPGLQELRGVLGNSFNSRDAKLIAGVYAEDAELIELTGETFKGRAAIEKHFADVFAANPNLRVTAAMTNERFVTPDVVLEDGTWESHAQEKGIPDRGRYTILMVHRDGQWRVVSHRSWVPVTQRPK